MKQLNENLPSLLEKHVSNFISYFFLNFILRLLHPVLMYCWWIFCPCTMKMPIELLNHSSVNRMVMENIDIKLEGYAYGYLSIVSVDDDVRAQFRMRRMMDIVSNTNWLSNVPRSSRKFLFSSKYLIKIENAFSESFSQTNIQMGIFWHFNMSINFE